MIEPGPAHLVRRAGAGLLRRAGVDSAEHDAAVLLGSVIGVAPLQLPLADDVTRAEASAYAALIARRARREPLQHITGLAHFYGLEIAVGRGVFVPRPETEILVQWAVERLANTPAPRVLDLCSGSGAIALAVATHLPGSEVTALENDDGALGWLRRNVAAIAPQVALIAADAADPQLRVRPGFDLITCNPPYVPQQVAVSAEVHHDPAVAVFSGSDGLELIRRLVPQFARLLRPGGAVIVEHDESHQSDVIALLDTADFTDVRPLEDLAGRPRFVAAIRAETSR